MQGLGAAHDEDRLGLVLQRLGDEGPAPGPRRQRLGLRDDRAAAADPQRFGRREAGLAGRERTEGNTPPLGVDEHGGGVADLQPEALAGDGPARAQGAVARIARDIAAGKGEGGGGDEGKVGLGRQQLDPEHRVHRPPDGGLAGGAAVGCAFGGVADEHRGRAGDDLAFDDRVADAGGGFATHEGILVRR
ncbi:hypothetical protein SDC9_157187 [bioreactor metagenome]|uniref:Uncharacterized protein n=1 Tax=bioreactor metagenome TaxID=1076179 RepID=A0A645FBG0_9ZZZZ